MAKGGKKSKPSRGSHMPHRGEDHRAARRPPVNGLEQMAQEQQMMRQQPGMDPNQMPVGVPPPGMPPTGAVGPPPGQQPLPTGMMPPR